MTRLGRFAPRNSAQNAEDGQLIWHLSREQWRLEGLLPATLLSKTTLSLTKPHRPVDLASPSNAAAVIWCRRRAIVNASRCRSQFPERLRTDLSGNCGCWPVWMARPKLGTSCRRGMVFAACPGQMQGKWHVE